ncbi:MULTISPECIES: ribonuclease H-like domain-containing protein [unclassified Haladaptatus]|uniref:ribonuclease H-like domain-containing protein n=1 Tax=unclassified Haladaptatus TaxID=2622732 RepID=UPI0023E79653|nr:MULTISPECIES: ribonuclease H-like domain-containing protein [unclassified Haladaptatus]
MQTGQGARLLAVRCDAVAELASDALGDLVAHFDPDLVYVVRERADMRTVSRLKRASDCSVIHADGLRGIRTETVSGVSLAFVNSTALIADAATRGSIPRDTDYVICDGLEPRIDAVTLAASLDGLADVTRFQASTDGQTTFLTGAFEASYDHVWEATVEGEAVRLPVRGLAPLRRSGHPELACLTFDGVGNIAVTSAPADRFGLQALSNVGSTTALRLKKAGYETREAVAEASEADLRAIHGIGESTARTIRQSARALAEGCVVRQTDEPIPAATYSPLFVDIETDGLSPTIIWLVGVYDPARDEYVDFVDTAPSHDDPGKATREFVEWLAAEYDRPSLVTWNGHNFDFKHLNSFIAHHAPEFAEFWRESVFEYDLYDWAIRQGNAVLPGRTNRLEAVAAALGLERGAQAASLDGKSLARAVGRALQSPDLASELDWEAARAYCEADVRELAAVYEAIAAATPGRERADAPTDDSTTQTGLTDF